jgi:hypothetical protein
MLVASMDFHPPPSVGPEDGRPWGWAISEVSPEVGQRGTQPDLRCPEARVDLFKSTWHREESMPSRTKLAGYFFCRMATVVARAETAIALTTLPNSDYENLWYTNHQVNNTGEVVSSYPRDGRRPVYGPAMPDYDHQHLCVGTFERLVLADDGHPPVATARFGPNMAASIVVSGGQGAMRGMVNVPLAPGRTGGMRNAAQLALSLMGGVRDTPFVGLCAQEGADILMQAPAAEFTVDLPEVGSESCMIPRRVPCASDLTLPCMSQELLGTRVEGRVTDGARAIVAGFLGGSVTERPKRHALVAVEDVLIT